MNVDPEVCLITSLMLWPDELPQAALRVKADDLKSSDARLVYRAMLDLHSSGQPVESCGVAERMIAHGCKPDAVSSILSILTDGEPHAGRIDRYAELIHKRSRARRIDLLGEKISHRCQANESPDEILTYVQQTVWEIESRRVTSEGLPVKQLMPGVLEHAAVLRKTGDGYPGISTSFQGLDVMTRGMKPSELWIIGALPGRGKTSFGLQIAVSAARSNIPVLIFSLEMSSEQLLTRMLGMELGVSAMGNPARMPREKWDTTLEYGAEVSNLPIFVDDSSELSPAELSLRARAKIRQHGIQLIIVDYLQLLRRPEREIREGVGNAANVLRQLAKDTRLPVLALSQLRRPGSENDRPTMLDLKESGDIEAHASHVILLYTPVSNSCPTGEDELIVGKNRTGPLGQIDAFFNRQTLTFAPRETAYRNTGESMKTSVTPAATQPLTQFEMIDGPTLAQRWQMKSTWVRKQTASADDPLPHVKLGRYVRFLWDSPELNGWLDRRYRR